MALIAPSILASNFLKLNEECAMVNESEADRFHLDVMDGRFVPNISFGIPVIEHIKTVAKKPCEVHLMIEEPEKLTEAFKKAGADILIVHVETCRNLHSNIQQIKSLGMKAGVAFNPHTPPSALSEILGDIHTICVMSVNPGFGGQKFIGHTCEKIRELRRMISQRGLHVLIEIDGGVTLENAAGIMHSGADILVGEYDIQVARSQKSYFSIKSFCAFLKMAKDLFSKQADLYAKYRPTYPPALIDYILGFVDNRHTAWDCATGNGQAALLYADYFEKVFATDISEKQIANAASHPKIIYSISEAEKTFFADNSFELLITVSQAYHWLQFDGFYNEATRVGKNGCIIACWGYKLAVAEDKKIDELVNYFYVDIVGKYWDAERKHVDAKYETVPFKFEKLPSKEFYINVEWNVDELFGYFSTWSSVQHFIKINNSNPIDEVESKIRSFWNDGSKKHFSFPVFLLLGKVVK